MNEERMDPALRKAIFQRSLNFWNNRVQKSMVNVVTVDELKKAGPYIGKRGGKWADPEHTIPWQEGGGKPTNDKQAVVQKLQSMGMSGKVDGIAIVVDDATGKKLESMGYDKLHNNRTNAYNLKEFLDKPAKGKSPPRLKVGQVLPNGWKVQRVSEKQVTVFLPSEKYMGAKMHKPLTFKWDGEGFKRQGQYLKLEKSLFKADARGGSYHRRVLSKKGKYRYYYDEDKYRNSKDAHLNGEEASKEAIKKGVTGMLDKANGTCPLKEMSGLVKKYGSKMVGSVLQSGCDGGDWGYANGKLSRKEMKKSRFVIKETKE
jgi:hypothetical protein